MWFWPSLLMPGCQTPQRSQETGWPDISSHTPGPLKYQTLSRGRRHMVRALHKVEEVTG